MMDTSFDEEGILDELIGSQFRSFVEDVTGEKPAFPSRSTKMLSALVDAIDKELQKLSSDE